MSQTTKCYKYCWHNTLCLYLILDIMYRKMYYKFQYCKILFRNVCYDVMKASHTNETCLIVFRHFLTEQIKYNVSH